MRAARPIDYDLRMPNTKTQAYAAQSAKTPMGPFTIDRREPGARDVKIDILYCGVCHSDLHTARGEWGGVKFPSVPGHEIVGRVSGVGSQVSRVKPGQFVGVGCMVDSCRTCSACKEGLEQYCEGPNGFTGTYNGALRGDAPNTYGGYSSAITVDEHFVLTMGHRADRLAAAAPLLCAGITTWSPLRHWKVGPGSRVGVVGIGGLGHMGIKLAHALGAHVIAITTSAAKREDAIKLGADEVVVSRNANEMARQAGSLHFILNTVAAPLDLDLYVQLLRRDGTMTLVGAPGSPHTPPKVFNLILGRRRLAGSAIGGIPETQEMLDFCAEKDITCDVEMIRMQEIEKAYERMLKSDVKYRFVIDMASLKSTG
jgi:alcohol dehydrogenase (NADP+)